MEFAVNNCFFSWLLSTTSSCVAALANPISLNVPFLYFFVGMCCGVCPCFVVVFLPFHMAIASLRSKCFWNCCSVIWGIALSLHVTFSCLISMIQIACKSLRHFAWVIGCFHSFFNFYDFIIIVFRFNQLMPLDGESVSRRISYYLVLVLQDPGSQTLQRCTLSFRFLNFHGFCMMYHNSTAFSEAG